MEFKLWLVFIATTFFISATPGPNMLLMLSHGVRYGWKNTLSTMSGAILGLLLLLALSAIGVGAILATSVHLFTALKIVGAMYLLYLGLQCWRAGNTLSLIDNVANTGYSRFRTGLGVALSNPKAILFAGAFLPQFIKTTEPQAMQWLVILSSFLVIELSWQLAYAWGGQRLSNWLQADNRIRAFNRCCGTAFFAAAGLLALSK